MKIIIVGVILVLGLFAYFWYRNHHSDTQTDSGSESAATSDAEPIELTDQQKADYLIKIRAYLAKLDPESYAPADPAKYQITSAEKTIHNDAPVIAVYLDCCYLGDIAFLDATTEEVVDFKAGAK